MRILFLGPVSPVMEYLIAEGHDVTQTTLPVDRDEVASQGFGFLISYGYQHILKKDVLDLFNPTERINLHISYLPYNRGADPNLWSWYDKTPKGVSIHIMDEGIDTGPVIHRRLVAFEDAHETLSTSYVKLHLAMVRLFKDAWPMLAKRQSPVPIHFSPRDGSYHSKSDRSRIEHLLTEGWDTPVTHLTKDFELQCLS